MKNINIIIDKCLDFIIKATLLSLVLLYFDYIKIINYIFDNPLYKFLSLFVIAIIMLKIFETGILSGLFFKFINFFDKMLFILILSASINIALLHYNLLKFMNHDFSLTFSLTVLLIGISILTLRLIFIFTVSIVRKIMNKNYANVNDLNVLYNNTFEKKDLEDKIIILEEKEVEYDLLGREWIETELYNYIVNSKFGRKLTIGLTGEWGVGKSSMLKCTLSKISDSKYIIIDDFDPWRYDDKEALLRGFFDTLMQKSGIRFSTIKLEAEYKRLKNILIKGEKANLIFNFFGKDEILPNIELNRMIEKHLTMSNKKIVFVVDNVDRTSDENIKFLFNIINNVFNFSNIIYILLYDKKIIDEITRTNSDKKFIDKVIDYEINIPELTKFHKKNLIINVIKNVYSKYDDKDIFEVISNDMIDELVENTMDIRDLKKQLNYIIPKIT